MQYAAVKLPHHNRYPYSAIPSRKTYEWPGGKRLAVNISNNIEIFAFRAGLGSDSATGTAPQNQRNYAWRDYGNRVGLWNYLDLLDEYGVPGSHNVNSMVLEECPEMVERINARGDEWVGHGRSNAERQDVLWEADEALLIKECTQSLIRTTGRKPEGWLGPYLAQSAVTLDLLEGGGILVRDGLAGGRPAVLDGRRARGRSCPCHTRSRSTTRRRRSSASTRGASSRR